MQLHIPVNYYEIRWIVLTCLKLFGNHCCYNNNNNTIGILLYDDSPWQSVVLSLITSDLDLCWPLAEQESFPVLGELDIGSTCQEEWFSEAKLTKMNVASTFVMHVFFIAAKLRWIEWACVQLHVLHLNLRLCGAMWANSIFIVHARPLKSSLLAY